MMKYIIIFAIILSGCTTPKIYNKKHKIMIEKRKKQKQIQKQTQKKLLDFKKNNKFCNDDKSIIISIYKGIGYLSECENYKITNVYNISSGKEPKYKTPRGVYTIQRKYRKYSSKQYPVKYGRNMDYSLFFKSGYAIHAGNPNMYSHGCVHINRNKAKYLFDKYKINDKVIINNI